MKIKIGNKFVLDLEIYCKSGRCESKRRELALINEPCDQHLRSCVVLRDKIDGHGGKNMKFKMISLGWKKMVIFTLLTG